MTCNKWIIIFFKIKIHTYIPFLQYFISIIFIKTLKILSTIDIIIRMLKKDISMKIKINFFKIIAQWYNDRIYFSRLHTHFAKLNSHSTDEWHAPVVKHSKSRETWIVIRRIIRVEGRTRFAFIHHLWRKRSTEFGIQWASIDPALLDIHSRTREKRRGTFTSPATIFVPLGYYTFEFN